MFALAIEVAPAWDKKASKVLIRTFSDWEFCEDYLGTIRWRDTVPGRD
jgi:hypothetical protein